MQSPDPMTAPNPHLQARPDWLALLTVAGQTQREFHAAEQAVLTQRDWQRYGLQPPGQEFPAKLKLTTYRQGTELVFWHLREEEKG